MKNSDNRKLEKTDSWGDMLLVQIHFVCVSLNFISKRSENISFSKVNVVMMTAVMIVMTDTNWLVSAAYCMCHVELEFSASFLHVWTLLSMTHRHTESAVFIHFATEISIILIQNATWHYKRRNCDLNVFATSVCLLHSLLNSKRINCWQYMYVIILHYIFSDMLRHWFRISGRYGSSACSLESECILIYLT